MSKPSRYLALGLILAFGVLGADAWAQGSGRNRGAGGRRPFAKPGTLKQPERIRYIDVKHIKAELTLDIKKKEVSGTVTHTISPLHPYLSRLELDCGSKLKVTKVTVGPKGVPCTFAVKGDMLSVTLDKPYGPSDTLDLSIAYAGSPEHGLHFVLPDPAYPEKPMAIWTQGEAEDTHHWLPCYDYPNDRATSEMIITVDKPLFVLSNGSLIETQPKDGNATTYHWKMDVPHVSYLISLAVADYSIYHDKFGDLPVDYYVAKRVDEPTARRFMGKTPRMIGFFADKTGRAYPYNKYAQSVMPEFGGGMENISATTMTDAALKDEIEALEGDSDGLVAHELAHQWFGDLLTCKDWSHLWLNEGFASYFDPLFAEHDRGEDAFRIEMNNVLQSYLGSDRGYRRPIVETRYESSNDMFDSVTYAKGSCVLHALRGLVGDEAWWKGIRRYVADHQLQVVETDDFRKAMEAAYGKDLKWFFDQWVYKAGHPELKIRWHYEDEDKTVRVRIQQTQKVDDQTPLFRLPTILAITEDVGRTRKVPIVIDGASHEFVIPSASRPKMVQVDPDAWLIKVVDFPKTEAENLFQLDNAACVLGRLEAARGLLDAAKTKSAIAKALSRAWKREKAVAARRELVDLLCNGQESFRTALLEAARDSEARVRVAAIGGLAKLGRDDTTESILRAAWSNKKEAYGARRAALRGLVDWKVEDAPTLLEAALKLPDDHHQIAAMALGILLETPGSKARELAAIYSRHGQPSALRSAAVRSLSRLAKEDQALQEIVLSLVDDPDSSLRYWALEAVRELKIARAVPMLKARLERESNGFSAFMRRRLQEAIEALSQLEPPAGRTNAVAGSPSDTTRGVAELEAQAVELEQKARELRNRISALKPGSRPADPAPKVPAAGTGSTH
ncbi:MAG: M1 family aminopeptidase [Isosphaeraceae bacterium]